jgi:hypothetical protein
MGWRLLRFRPFSTQAVDRITSLIIGRLGPHHLQEQTGFVCFRLGARLENAKPSAIGVIASWSGAAGVDLLVYRHPVLPESPG